MQKIRWWDSWPSFISPGSGNMGWWDLTINDSLMAHFKFLYLLAYFVSVFAFRRWRGWQDQKSCHGFLSISFKLYISELHLDDVYEDFDRTRWNDRNGCFESQTKGVGGRDNNSIIIITTMINPKNCDLDQQKWVKVKWCEWGNWSGQGGHVKYTNIYKYFGWKFFWPLPSKGRGRGEGGKVGDGVREVTGETGVTVVTGVTGLTGVCK